MLKIIIVIIALQIFTYLLIVGGSMDKTDVEQKLEDDAQMEYLRKYNEVKRYGKKRI